MPPAARSTTGRRRPGGGVWRAAGATVVTGLLVVALGVGCGNADNAERADGTGPPTTSATSTGEAARPTTTATDDTPTTAAGCAATAPPAAGTERVELSSGGADRWYDRLVPTSYAGEPTPLVVDLHGYLSGAEGQAAMSGFGTTSEQEGFVLATPQGNGDLAYWNAVPHPDLPDDVGFVADVIDDVSAAVCIDRDRIYVDGMSNGAFLASLVACELADRVAAVAAVAGLLVPEDCAPSRSVPVLAIHGTADRYVPVTGGRGPALDDLAWDDDSTRAFDGLAFGDVAEAAARWAELDGCDPEPERTAVSDEVEATTYGGCDDDATVELYVVDGGGHAWPGSDFSHASADIVGPTTFDIDATDLIWTFFEEHPRP